LLGLLGVPAELPVLGPLLGNNPFHHFLAEQFNHWQYVHLPHVGFNPSVMLISAVMAGIGIGLGYLVYGRKPLQAGQPDPLTRLGAVWTLLRNKYYIDEFYRATIIRGTIGLANVLFRFDQGIIDAVVNLIGKLTERWSYVSRLFDTYVIDGIVDGVGRVTSAVGEELRFIQTGRVQNYMVIVVISVVLLMGVFLYM
jgi:NADH-quinone oxidoreductase subunit L